MLLLDLGFWELWAAFEPALQISLAHEFPNADPQALQSKIAAIKASPDAERLLRSLISLNPLGLDAAYPFDAENIPSQHDVETQVKGTVDIINNGETSNPTKGLDTRSRRPLGAGILSSLSFEGHSQTFVRVHTFTIVPVDKDDQASAKTFDAIRYQLRSISTMERQNVISTMSGAARWEQNQAISLISTSWPPHRRLIVEINGVRVPNDQCRAPNHHVDITSWIQPCNNTIKVAQLGDLEAFTVILQEYATPLL